MDYKEVMNLVDKYVDLLDDPNDPDYIEIKVAYRMLENKIKALCMNQKVTKIEQEAWSKQLHERAEQRKKYQGPSPRPACNCEGWGCFGCCNTEQEIRGRQGTFG